MSGSDTIIEEFEKDTIDYVQNIYEAIRDFSDVMVQADGDVDRDVVRRKLILLVLETLMQPYNGAPQYDLTLIPEWMRKVSRTQGANSGLPR